MATDPVCGMQVDEQSTAGGSMFGGRNYYFCYIACKKKFDETPSLYDARQMTAHPDSVFALRVNMMCKTSTRPGLSKLTTM